VKNEVMSVVCRAMFGEERVNNSVDLLSRVLVTFSVGQISTLVAVILREDFVYNCHTSTGARWLGYAALRATCSFHRTYRVTALMLQLAVSDA